MLVYITCELGLLNCLDNLFLIAIQLNQASLVAQTIKNLPALQDTWDWFLGRKDPLEREWLPAPVFLTGEFRGQRSLVGCSLWGLKESDTTEHFIVSLSLHFIVTPALFSIFFYAFSLKYTFLCFRYFSCNWLTTALHLTILIIFRKRKFNLFSFN